MKFKNAFEALGFEHDDATVLQLRSEFAAVLRDWIRNQQITQAKISETLNIPQSAVSDILRRKIGSKSVEYFIRLLARAAVPWSARCSNAPNVDVVQGNPPLEWAQTWQTRTALVDYEWRNATIPAINVHPHPTGITSGVSAGEHGHA
jgi:predicted XRE-type DNA-binding protein